MSRIHRVVISAAVIAVVSAGALTATRANAVVPLDPVAVRAAAVAAGLDSLRNVTVPQINNIGDFLNPGPGPRSMAVIMGKALFWDTQVGSDGVACATCHFQAGADVRAKDQLNPGLKAGDSTFGNAAVAGVAGWAQFGTNYQLDANDFPFHKVAEAQKEDYNHRVITHDTNDVASSQGVFGGTFTGVVPGQLTDNGTIAADPLYRVGDVNTRHVEPRNTPSVINAVFNVDNFWDGRARSQFNGVNPFGPLDGNASILLSNNNTLSELSVLIPNSSLASQAVGPPLSDLEMSYAGRTFPDVGRKLLTTRPLAFQRVSQTDGVMGGFSRDAQGLDGLTFNTYAEMVQAVFQPKYWSSNQTVTIDGAGHRTLNLPPGTPGSYTQTEANFSLFFGMAVQAYESTLVSDRTRFDQFMEGDDSVLTQDEMAGLLTFINKGTAAQLANPVFANISQGSCTSCHGTATFSDATFTGMGVAGPIEVDLAPIMIDGTVRPGTETVLIDNGFYNIGVRPTTEDIGRGETILGKPLSAAHQAQLGIPFAPRLPANAPSNARVVADGSFKVPILRNVELTGPYFHTGSYQTLRQVLDFYHRHGDFADTNIANLDAPLASVKLDARVTPAGQDIDADQLIKFLLTLTDDRVRNEIAPFDHPAIDVPEGHPGSSANITQFNVNPVSGVKQAADTLRVIPAVGRDGRVASGLTPVEPFLSMGNLQANLIRLRAGWNTMSVPVRLADNQDTWGEFVAYNGLNVQPAFAWNGTSFQIVTANYTLTPLEAIFVQMNAPAVVELSPYSGVSAPPSKMLNPGWNLVGAAFLDAQMPVRDALISIQFAPNNLVPNTLPLWGYGQVVSPTINALGWTYIRDALVIPNMMQGEGYWVYMVNPGQISGFTSTPVQLR